MHKQFSKSHIKKPHFAHPLAQLNSCGDAPPPFAVWTSSPGSHQPASSVQWHDPRTQTSAFCNDKKLAIYSTRTKKKRNSSMNMFTYVHHKNQPPQVAGIPTKHHQWDSEVRRSFYQSLLLMKSLNRWSYAPFPPLASGRIPNPIALFPFKLRAPTPILSQHTSPKSPYTIRTSQLMSTHIEQHVQSPTPSPTP